MSPDEPVGAQFQFRVLHVTKACFELIGSAQPTERPTTIDIGLEVGAQAQLSADATAAFVTLETRVKPDPKFQPYRIEVVVGAAFASQRATQEELLKFCRVAVPSILFPYIREIVHRITMDAPNGAIRLDPINVSAMLNQSDWDVRTSDAPNPSIEPAPPSSQ